MSMNSLPFYRREAPFPLRVEIQRYLSMGNHTEECQSSLREWVGFSTNLVASYGIIPTIG